LENILLKEINVVTKNANALHTQQYFGLTSELIVSHYQMREKANNGINLNMLKDMANGS